MAVLSAESLVVFGLRHGPASGTAIAAAAQRLTGDPSVLRPGTLYPLLRRLEAAGLVRSWPEARPSGVGRPRRFHELTVAGIMELYRQESLLHSLVSPLPTKPPPALVRSMRANLKRAFAVSAVAMRLREGRTR